MFEFCPSLMTQTWGAAADTSAQRRSHGPPRQEEEIARPPYPATGVPGVGDGRHRSLRHGPPAQDPAERTASPRVGTTARRVDQRGVEQRGVNEPGVEQPARRE